LQNKNTPMKTSKPTRSARQMRPVRFTLPYLPAQQVTTAGSFNDWDPNGLPLFDGSGSRWEIEVPLPAGTYEYRFIVDGRWITDPNNPTTRPNPFGELNSVASVSAPSLKKAQS